MAARVEVRATPPATESSRAGDLEVVSMVKESTGVAGWIRRTGAAWLAAAVLLGGAAPAGARSFNPEPGPEPDGDPTADDQPSPGPKLRKSMSISTMQRHDRRDATMGQKPNARYIWLSYVRVWIRIALR
jgi:hypothetical protein